jgi:uncharacterized membrane protein YedE/YeeE
MTRAKKQIATALVAGLLFGAGLAVGGMTNPRKVIGFLDIGGAWDPSLAFVMLGAIAVHFFAYRWVRGSAAPLFADEFAIPKLRHIDAKLVAGSALFGVGWGLGGYCPGPGIVSLGAGRSDALVFVASMAIGWFFTAKYDAWRAERGSEQSSMPGRGTAEVR